MNTLAETERVAAALAHHVQCGDTLALRGEMGAGKTTLVAALVAALGGPVAASPTFALLHEYLTSRGIVWHADLYRLQTAAELAPLGFDDILQNARGFCIVEWADKFPLVPEDALWIEIEVSVDPYARRIAFAGRGRGGELARALYEALDGAHA